MIVHDRENEAAYVSKKETSDKLTEELLKELQVALAEVDRGMVSTNFI